MEELKKVQHEALGMDTGISEVRTVIEEAVFFGADSVCVPSCYMKEAKEYGKRIQAVTGNKSCSLFAAVGYPSGYAGTSIKKGGSSRTWRAVKEKMDQKKITCQNS